MISASHNPYHDNGIKLFGPDGYKLSDAIELAIEERMLAGGDDGLASPDQLGRAVRMEGARERYIEALKATLPKGMSLGGLRIVIDCAHGAAYGVAPKVLWELGAEVIELGTQPNGFNINAECGSTAPEAMRAAVLEHGADLGVALDGDADRLVLADERGELIDGDQMLALLATHWQTEGCCAAAPWLRPRCRISVSSATCRAGDCTCNGPRSAIATWSSRCGAAAATSAASSPAT